MLWSRITGTLGEALLPVISNETFVFDFEHIFF